MTGLVRGLDLIESKKFRTLPATCRTFASEAVSQQNVVPAKLTEVELRKIEEEYSSSIVNGRSIYEPIYHEKTHGIPAATIHLRSYHISLLSMFTHFVAHSASALGIPISKPVPLPIKRNLWTVPRGPFIHKKAQENFDRKTLKRAIKAWDTDPEVVERWVRYLEKHALAGVGMRVVRWERAPVGVGQKVANSVKAAMDAARLDTPKEQVKALGEQIVKQELSSPTTASKSEVQVLQ